MMDDNEYCFLDRDGVINKDLGYTSLGRFSFLEGSIEALKILTKKYIYNHNYQPIRYSSRIIYRTTI